MTYYVSSPLNRDNTWFLVAGGPSLKGFDGNILNGYHTIAINRAFELIPFAEITYFTDFRFWEWYRDKILSIPGRIITSCPHVNHARIEYYKLTGKAGLEENSGKLKSGNNSGYAAINLAYHMGAKNIVLLGYDMRFSKEGDCHWHDPYKVMNEEKTFTEKMLPYFDSLVIPLEDKGIKVLNTSLLSAIECFEKKELSKILEDIECSYL